MKTMPTSERPYEKLLNYGESSLSNAELLAIILKSGTKSETSVQLAQKVLMLDEDNSLANLANLQIPQLTKIKGIGVIKAIQIKAAVELAKRIAKPNNVVNTRISNAKDIFNLLRYECINQTKESLYLVALTIKNDVIKISKIGQGGQTQVSTSISEIYHEAIRLGSSGIIVAHNHPSGDTKPSNTDINFTYRLIEASKILDISFLDHIIISNSGFTSLKEKGIID